METAEEPWPTMEEVQLKHLLATCERLNWSRRDVALALGVSVKTVYNWLNRCEELGMLRRKE